MKSQIEILLPTFARGFHLITDLILKELPTLPEIGLLHVFIQHTSAGLTINENCDPTVRSDFEKVINHMIPENLPFLEHIMEGPDDMPAHIKSTLLGNSISIPITNSALNLGTWQGIYLAEFRNRGGRRKLVITVM